MSHAGKPFKYISPKEIKGKTKRNKIRFINVNFHAVFLVKSC